jgi:hypothetical protein
MLNKDVLVKLIRTCVHELLFEAGNVCNIAFQKYSACSL